VRKISARLGRAQRRAQLSSPGLLMCRERGGAPVATALGARALWVPARERLRSQAPGARRKLSSGLTATCLYVAGASRPVSQLRWAWRVECWLATYLSASAWLRSW
jgi:hypothetical protein